MVRNVLQVDEGGAYQLFRQSFYCVEVLLQGWPGVADDVVTTRERESRNSRKRLGLIR